VAVSANDLPQWQQRKTRVAPIVWDAQLTSRLVQLDNERRSYAQIAVALGVPEPKVRTKIYAMRGRGELERRPPVARTRAAPVPILERDPVLSAEVIEMREEGLTREEILGVTGASQQRLGDLLKELGREGRVPRAQVPRGAGEEIPDYAGVPELLSDDEVRVVHAEYMEGARVTARADQLGVRPYHLYRRYKELQLPTRSSIRQAASADRAQSRAS
jgi:hypothetical protein